MRNSARSSTRTCPRRPTPTAAPPRVPTSPGVGPSLAAHWFRGRLAAARGNPPEFGGRNAGIVEQFVHLRNSRAGAHLPQLQPAGMGIIAASLLTFGTPEQKQRWAVPILRAEITAALAA